MPNRDSIMLVRGAKGGPPWAKGAMQAEGVTGQNMKDATGKDEATKRKPHYAEGLGTPFMNSKGRCLGTYKAPLLYLAVCKPVVQIRIQHLHCYFRLQQ